MDNLENEANTELAIDNTTIEAVAAEVDQQGATNAEGETQEAEFEVSGEEQDSQNAVPVKKFKKLRRRAQTAEGERDEWKTEAQKLKEKLEKLESQVNKKPMPTLDSCDYDEDKYQAAMQAYYSNSSPSDKKPEAKSTQANSSVAQQFLDDHYSRASSLPVSEERYEEAEGSFRQSMVDAFGGNGNNVAEAVLQEALDSSHLVAFALGNANRQQALIRKLKADPTGYQAKIYIKDLAKKASFKKKDANVTTKPDVIPEGSSNSDSLKAQYDAAFKKWQSDPTVANHRKAKELKKRL